MRKTNVLNLDYDTISNVSENSIEILKSLQGRDDGICNCKFQLTSKQFELKNGKLYIGGRKLAESTHNDVCQCLLELIGWMQFFLSCGADQNDIATDVKDRG